MVAFLNSFSRSEWCGPVVAGIIVLLLVLFWSGTGDQARAYTNRIKYWAKGGPDGQRDEGSGRIQKFTDSSPSMIEDVSHRGRVSKSQRCHNCHVQMQEYKRMMYADKSVYVEYKCPHCREKKLVRYR